MSIKLMGQVWDDVTVGGSELLVLLSLADHANDDGICWPSIPRLAMRARLSERQTQRVLHKLEELGHIEVLTKGDGRGHSTLYRVLIKDDKMSPIVEERVTSATERVTSSALKGDIAMSPESSVEPSVKPLKKDDEDNARVRGDAAVFKAWAENIPGTMTPILSERLHDLTDECGERAVIHGIVTSVEAGARNFKYIAACARNHAAGVEPVKREDDSKHRRNNNAASNRRAWPNRGQGNGGDTVELDPEIQRRVDEHRARRKAEGSAYYNRTGLQLSEV